MTPRKTIISTLIIALLAVGIFYVKKNPVSIKENTSSVEQTQTNQQLTIGGVHYLLDVSDQNPAQIKSLLNRAEEVSISTTSSGATSRIVMVIHGPNIDLFDKKNYLQNRELIEQAARLDALNVIDFKVCQRTATSRGIKKTSFPDFLEVVPFASIELNSLAEKGYVDL